MNKPSTRIRYLSGFVLVVLLLSIAFFLQKYDGVIPCPLCVLQRIAMALLGVLFFFGTVNDLNKWGNRIVSVFAIVLSALGIFLSGRQVWLQHQPLSQTGDCGVSLQYLIHVLPPAEVIHKVLSGTADCSQIGMMFLGLSLAEWSLIAFLFFLLFSAYQAIRFAR